MVEIGLLTPPVGIQTYVLKGVVPHIPLNTIFMGILPFFLVDLIIVIGFFVLWDARRINAKSVPGYIGFDGLEPIHYAGLCFSLGFLGFPFILYVMNMKDIQKNAIKIDWEPIEKLLGVSHPPVVEEEWMIIW